MPKVAAAMITGTMARPSRPSVRLTALPAPTITKMPTRMKKKPSGMTTVLKKGTVSDEEKPGVPSRMTAIGGDAGDGDLGGQPPAGRRSPLVPRLVTLR